MEGVEGAEVSALRGFRRYLAKTRSIAVSTPYGEVPGDNARACAALLDEHGFTVLPSPNPNLVLATGATRSRAPSPPA